MVFRDDCVLRILLVVQYVFCFSLNKCLDFITINETSEEYCGWGKSSQYDFYTPGNTFTVDFESNADSTYSKWLINYSEYSTVCGETFYKIEQTRSIQRGSRGLVVRCLPVVREIQVRIPSGPKLSAGSFVSQFPRLNCYLMNVCRSS